jgi:predicted DNA-binding protein (MmcQ/YjbR family)
MSVETIRRICMSLPHVTETVQWGNDLVFKVAGKMFAVTALEPSAVWLSMKCTPDDFSELTERAGIIPAPYLARAQWVGLETEDAMTAAELKVYLRRAYETVVAKLPAKARAEISGVASKRTGPMRAAGKRPIRASRPSPRSR